MKFTLERVAEPEIELLTLAEMRRQLRAFADVTEEDDDITNLIIGGRQWVEHYTSRALVDQAWRLTLHGRAGVMSGGDTVYGHPGPGPVNYSFYEGFWRWGRYGEIPLRRAPVLAVTSFVTVDSAGAETAVDPATYELREADSKRPRIVALDGATWSTWLTSDMRVTFRAGFADRTGSPQQGAEVVPGVFKQAIILWAKAYYSGNDIADIPTTIKAAESLLEQECVDLQLA